MQLSYVLPEPARYNNREQFEYDLSEIKRWGYDAVELQITNPEKVDKLYLKSQLDRFGLPLCAIQTGGSYSQLGNCLCTADEIVRRRTVSLLKSFIVFASEFSSLLVFGSLQGRKTDESDEKAGERRIRESLLELREDTLRYQVTIALEPVNHMETGWHHTIREIRSLVEAIDSPGIQMMIDTFHMNIEEKSFSESIRESASHLAHVHLSETNRDVFGSGHWDFRDFLSQLEQVDYRGYCSVGVYNTRLPRAENIALCMNYLKSLNMER